MNIRAFVVLLLVINLAEARPPDGGGAFAAPTRGSDALEAWGTLGLDVQACDRMTMSTDTLEGAKISDAVQLVGIVGLNCP